MWTAQREASANLEVILNLRRLRPKVKKPTSRFILSGAALHACFSKRRRLVWRPRALLHRRRPRRRGRRRTAALQPLPPRQSDYIGEPMSITEHSVQTALAAKKAARRSRCSCACCTSASPASAGHAPGMDGCGTEDPRGGGRRLPRGARATHETYLARHHVDAKRPVRRRRVPCAAERRAAPPKDQGGPMSAAEVHRRGSIVGGLFHVGVRCDQLRDDLDMALRQAMISGGHQCRRPDSPRRPQR